MSGPDVLFPLRNNFYLGAFQAAINESNVRNLSDADATEKDSFVYRSYIALGQYQVINLASGVAYVVERKWCCRGAFRQIFSVCLCDILLWFTELRLCSWCRRRGELVFKGPDSAV